MDAVSAKTSTASPAEVFRQKGQFPPNGRSFRGNKYGEPRQSFSPNWAISAKLTQFPPIPVRRVPLNGQNGKFAKVEKFPPGERSFCGARYGEPRRSFSPTGEVFAKRLEFTPRPVRRAPPKVLAIWKSFRRMYAVSAEAGTASSAKWTN